MNAVQALYRYRKSISTKPFNARGKMVQRCEFCRVSIKHCICGLVQTAQSNAGFLLLMYDTEILKPSNTGRLIADVIKDTFAFLWSRTELDRKLSELLESEEWQPFIVFPHEYAGEGREVFVNQLPYMRCKSDFQQPLKAKRPLFVLLDGSWREAKKMFRKSPYLDKYPVISFQPDMSNGTEVSHYIRESMKNNQLATAEVAANMLSLWGEHDNAKLLATWFDVFNYQYQLSVCQVNKGDASALARLKSLSSGKTS